VRLKPHLSTFSSQRASRSLHSGRPLFEFAPFSAYTPVIQLSAAACMARIWRSGMQSAGRC